MLLTVTYNEVKRCRLVHSCDERIAQRATSTVESASLFNKRAGVKHSRSFVSRPSHFSGGNVKLFEICKIVEPFA